MVVRIAAARQPRLYSQEPRIIVKPILLMPYGVFGFLTLELMRRRAYGKLAGAAKAPMVLGHQGPRLARRMEEHKQSADDYG